MKPFMTLSFTLSPLQPVMVKTKHKESSETVKILFISSPANPCDNIHSDDRNRTNRVNAVDHDTYLHQF